MRIFLTDISIASVMTEAHLLKHLAPTDDDPSKTATRTRQCRRCQQSLSDLERTASASQAGIGALDACPSAVDNQTCLVSPAATGLPSREKS
jgi:hypothetical protein